MLLIDSSLKLKQKKIYMFYFNYFKCLKSFHLKHNSLSYVQQQKQVCNFMRTKKNVSNWISTQECCKEHNILYFIVRVVCECISSEYTITNSYRIILLVFVNSSAT